ncbi:MAG: TlpA family protein disulfide reductase [Actinomycetota bacterium]|nr:TlpA family protein disulfide reductase [Actinomycetota bacterium]
MPDDPFADLGGRRSRAEAIGDELAERDRVEPEEAPRRPESPRPRNRYAWAVGIAAFGVIGAVLLLNGVPNRGKAVLGPKERAPLPAFAAPLASGGLEGDANFCQRTPCPEGAGKVPACELRSDQVLNSCSLRGGPAVLTFVVTQGTDCEPQVDRVERMRREFPGVDFAVVLSGLERDEAVQIVRRRRWTLPVGLDPDGAVTNLYGVGVCPTTVLSDARGRVRETKLGNLTEQQLRERVGRLAR